MVVKKWATKARRLNHPVKEAHDLAFVWHKGFINQKVTVIADFSDHIKWLCSQNIKDERKMCSFLYNQTSVDLWRSSGPCWGSKKRHEEWKIVENCTWYIATYYSMLHELSKIARFLTQGKLLGELSLLDIGVDFILLTFLFVNSSFNAN